MTFFIKASEKVACKQRMFNRRKVVQPFCLGPDVRVFFWKVFLLVIACVFIKSHFEKSYSN